MSRKALFAKCTNTTELHFKLTYLLDEIMRITGKAMFLTLMSAFETCKDGALVLTGCRTLASHHANSSFLPLYILTNSYKHHQQLSSITKYVIVCDW